jgi:hypothetical protein
LRIPSSIIGVSTTHYIRTFTTKHADQFLTTNDLISDAPAGYIFTEVCPQLDWCLWIYSVFIYPCTHGKSTIYTFLYGGCILRIPYWWHTIIINILNRFICSCGGRALLLFYITNFKNILYIPFLILDWALHFIIIFYFFNSVSVYIMVSFLSLVCDFMYV